MKNEKNLPKFPDSVEEICKSISNQIKEFCDKHLYKDYFDVSQKVLLGLARKKPSPLLRGQFAIWACAIIYAVGQENFLFDKDNDPYVSAQDLRKYFNCSESTISNKAKEIRTSLKMQRFDAKWQIAKMIDENPMAWMIQVNGFIIDARMAPREIQEEAFKMGLIPYIPKK